jgi:hypothetical protein
MSKLSGSLIPACGAIDQLLSTTLNELQRMKQGLAS